MKPSQIGNQVAANPTAKIAVTRRSRLTTLGAGFLLAALTLINGSRAFSLEAVVKDSHIKVGGNPYFRRGAEMVYLGSCGDKKTPITGENYLDVDYTISADKLSNIEKAQVYTINYKNTTKTDLFGTLSDVKKVFGFDADAAWEKVKSGELVLLELVMDNSHITKAANQSSAALNNLRNRGNGARIASRILVVVKAEVAETFQRSSSFSASATNGKLTVKAGGTTGSSGNDSVIVSKGSTYAYGLVKLDWESGKDKIDSVQADWWGMN